MDDLDRYYTPPRIADQLFRDGIRGLASCADSACGGGSLLHAATRAFGALECVGLDKDRHAIARLRRAQPKWHLSVGDILNPKLEGGAGLLARQGKCDLVALNPPFSMARIKWVQIRTVVGDLRCSVAMAHILRSLQLFSPRQGAVAIVPESLLYSDVDKCARRVLGERYTLKLIKGLRNSTFKGARANAVVLRLLPGVTNVKSDDPVTGTLTESAIIRGGLPLFEAREKSSGVRLVHSTNIADVVRGNWAPCSHVEAIARGNVSGVVILLPRVGLPLERNCVPINLKERIQLSDCVIALKFASMAIARVYAQAIRRNWSRLIEQYRGTGARYTTVMRLNAFMSSIEASLGRSYVRR